MKGLTTIAVISHDYSRERFDDYSRDQMVKGLTTIAVISGERFDDVIAMISKV